MQINVAQLLKEPVGTKRVYKIDETTDNDDENRVIGEATLTRTNLGILLTGEISANVKGTCTRCLGEACVKVTFNMEDEYFPIVDINTGAHLHPDLDEFTIDDSHILDLEEAIRQYIIMATPTKILCRQDCPGICPVCGHEFAKGNCQHKNRPYDRRWERLLQLEKESKV